MKLIFVATGNDRSKLKLCGIVLKMCGNVFIFNLNKNNEKNVELLKETFEKFLCIVKIYEKPTKAGIENAAKELSECQYGAFKYVVIVVLNNCNKSEDVITSSDGHTIYLQSEFLSVVLQNPSLMKKNILFLLQINRVFPDEVDDGIYREKQEEKVKQEEITKQQEDTKELTYLFGNKKFYFYACETMMPLPQRKDDLFIETFCEVFVKYGHKYSISEICAEMGKILKKKGYGGKPTMERCEDQVFSYAMDKDDYLDYYPYMYRKHEQEIEEQLQQEN